MTHRTNPPSATRACCGLWNGGRYRLGGVSNSADQAADANRSGSGRLTARRRHLRARSARTPRRAAPTRCRLPPVDRGGPLDFFTLEDVDTRGLTAPGLRQPARVPGELHRLLTRRAGGLQVLSAFPRRQVGALAHAQLELSIPSGFTPGRAQRTVPTRVRTLDTAPATNVPVGGFGVTEKLPVAIFGPCVRSPG